MELGYKQLTDPRFVLMAHEGERQMKEAVRLINGADVVIAGAAPDEMLTERMKSGKPVYRYSERPFKEKISLLKRIYHSFSFHARDHGNKNVCMLCASAYAAADFKSIGMYKNRAYKWGYFPVTRTYDPEDLIAKKDPKTILWCGRFLDWKHPDDALSVAARLKTSGYDFCMNIIGSGEMKQDLTRMTAAAGLTDRVRFLGSMSPDEVRGHMEKAGILLFTSDRFEGWGAVLNEAMNSGCAVVASHAAGSVLFLIDDNRNGLIYESGNVEMLYRKVSYLLSHPESQAELGAGAYDTIIEEWNAETAAERLISLAEQSVAGKTAPRFYESGIGSKAEILSFDWKK